MPITKVLIVSQKLLDLAILRSSHIMKIVKVGAINIKDSGGTVWTKTRSGVRSGQAIRKPIKKIIKILVRPFALILLVVNDKFITADIVSICKL